MKENNIDTPVLFLIFNRPDTTRIVFDAIRKVKPVRLYVAADGPRENKPGEKERCDETRKITEKIDWPCEVKRLYRDKNLGCKMSVSSAISWFFDNVEAGIILEDDCLPDASFFRFCQENLSRYRDDHRIMHITGDNYQKKNVTQNSYYYSIYPHIWGWATWKRAWSKYDVEISDWNRNKNIFLRYFYTLPQKMYWTLIFKLLKDGKIDTWDYQWLYTCLVNNGLSVTPKVNLVTNIGFSPDATHTKKSSSNINKPLKKIHFPLKHPQNVKQNLVADRYITQNNFKPSLLIIFYLITKNIFN